MSPMNSRSFLVDENTSRSLVSALRLVGHSAEHVYDANLQGRPDSEVFTYAQSQQQVIITGDLDFSNITQYPPPHLGIIVLRLSTSTSTTDLIHEVQNALTTLAEEDFANTLFIVEPGRVRIRR